MNAEEASKATLTRVALIGVASAMQSAEGLHLADNLPAGGFGFEQLPDEALEGEPQVEDPVATVGALVLRRKQRRREEVA